ncbi:biotin-dependent carboxyltransferase family protein [Burkholderia dolosa]|uniref:5-oxoprolinase subunit C family protein n=1 Tax=Burkholderia dolosa TaxID=152500 RepID=UPI001B91BB5F|nr:biotin-dependent carboxyltransferase family protein [Burkholderia dolosa]MBR8457085.1 biotin-dependent carboxyltransferase family protein [Burkholderia dolosa]MDN7419416.1 biotin-dependent carboxyltransferase family protein [Burkholderia dolosa]
MTAATLEIRSNGALNVVQDLGRQGWLAQGVSNAGAMDVDALRLANALAGNVADSAVIEISLFPFRAQLLADATLAWTGADSTVTIDGVQRPPWWSAHVRSGQSITIAPPRRGARVYLACGGGFDVPQVLGSRSTDLKGGFGGLEGRGLKRGDLLAVAGPSLGTPRSFGLLPPARQELFNELDKGVVTLRAIAAAEYDRFTTETQVAFEQTAYVVTSEANRTGYRLEGAPLALAERLELLSHGIVPGTVQVPPNGQPIIQLADANTCGGYPKIATVIETDLWRVAQAPVGTRLRFEMVSADTAAQQLRAYGCEHQRLTASIEHQRRHP